MVSCEIKLKLTEKQDKKPKLKSNRNKLNSIPFPDAISHPRDNKVSIKGVGVSFGKVKFFKQTIPEGKIKNGRILKRASGLTGPRGLRGLAVRSWECSACGSHHDRDINAAMVVLKTGLGLSLENRNE